MLGRDLLVAPVLYAGLDTRRLWFPPGSWHGFFDSKAYSGGQWLEVATTTIPVFVLKVAAIAEPVELQGGLQTPVNSV
jgi:alpha-glucosidase (family GH31 glycosyl hydrolase)